tara:strand:- start:318 stop:965 length:648 start_codon:yes stop_codon:yes gene_type:complete
MLQSELKHNIYNALNLGQLAIDEHRYSGYSWYEVAKHETARFANAHNVSPEVAALVLAGCSRSCSVWESFKRANIYLEAGSVYFAGDYCDSLLERYRLTGRFGSKTSPKVSAFCHNVLNGDSDVLTLDRHAYSLAICEKVDGVPVTLERKVRRAYHVVGQETKLPLSRLQSMAWLGWRSIDPAFGFGQAEVGRHHADVFADFTPCEYLRTIELGA